MKNHKLILLLIVAFGFLFRLAPIQWGLPSSNLALSTFTPDEQESFHSLEHMNPGKLDFYPRRILEWGSVHLYLMAVTLKAAEIAGFVKFGSRDYYMLNFKELDKLYITARLISTISAAISIALIYFVILSLFSSVPLALSGSALLAVIPVHLMYSFLSRPDTLLMMFGLCVIYVSIKILRNGSRRDYVLCAALTGITIATKYSGGAYLVVPVLAHLSYLHRERQLSLKNIINKNLIISSAVVLAAFACASPYSVSPMFIPHLKFLGNVSKGSAYDAPGWIRVLTQTLPLGMGWPVFLASVCGFVALMVAWVKDREPVKLFLTLSGLVVYLAVSLPRRQMTVYTMPLLPFMVIYAAYFLRGMWSYGSRHLKLAGRLLAVFVVAYTVAYSIAYWRLFLLKNTRVEASEWIEKNIPQGDVVAIARSYFWTPPILRQYNPPYKLLMGGDIQSAGPDAMLGFKNVSSQADYLVLTEYEYRDYIQPGIKENFPAQSAIINEIFSEKRFKKIAEFDREASFLGFTFKKTYAPVDWLFPNPKIVVFKKISV